MSKRFPKPLIIDMQECVANLIEYTAFLTYDEFLADRKTRDAVLRNIQVLGEAANRLPEDFRKKYPEIEWGKIIRSRHVTTHEYDKIDYTIVWRIVTVHIIGLKTSLEKIRFNLDN